MPAERAAASPLMASPLVASPLVVSAPAAMATGRSAVAAGEFLAVVIGVMVEMCPTAEMARLVAVFPVGMIRVVPVPGLVSIAMCVVFQESVSFVRKVVFVFEW